jgi:hypothetical protein
MDENVALRRKPYAARDSLLSIGYGAIGLNHDATLRDLERIGAAATPIPEPVRSNIPLFPGV